MHTEREISFDCEEHLQQQSNISYDGALVAVPSSLNHAEPQPPAKRPTRQWAAWTREEEESFFTALRQVGKNFERITYRVQSKNKDQVRHYYYRLVRRMNKLLGPGLSLDAKNSKDTNAAMLRWWSLLEKFSCKATKLHLKPRRFKVFVEALEYQLQKDRKKNVKRRSPNRENISYSAPSSLPNQSKHAGNDARAVKLVLVDSQNIQKAGNTKGSSVRRNRNVGVCRKGETSPTKVSRQRRKPGAVSATVNTKWEKAAIAGMSLVADAAEFLERAACNNVDISQGRLDEPALQETVVNREQCGVGISEQGQSCLLNASGTDPALGNSQNTSKLKLQLFPFNEHTRKALEMDKHNPYLELTLSLKKKISSVLEHLTRKWGNSSAASGELMLFPCNLQSENVMHSQRWTQDSVTSVADAYAFLGKPSIFRLRYGWISNTELQSAPSSLPDKFNMSGNNVAHHTSCSDPLWKVPSNCHGQQTLAINNPVIERCPNSALDDNVFSSSLVGDDHTDGLFKSFNVTASRASFGTATKELDIKVDQRFTNGVTLSPGEWADSLTNISIGDLLQEASDNVDRNCDESHVPASSQCLEQIPFTCDSFDAAIAAHIYRHQERIGFQSGMASNQSSIWDGEEACDAFSFMMKRSTPDERHPLSSNPASSETCEGNAQASTAAFCSFDESMRELETVPEDAEEIDPMDECPPEREELVGSGKEFGGLSDIYWPDSLGPLDLDVPSCKYYSEELILSDSLGGVNRLIASSLDAFQSCSFLGIDKKEPVSASQVQGDAVFSDVQVCGGGGSGSVSYMV
ncbi:hypothetical protein Droror1_Dr00026209 [Drosera rotundifolia]